MGRKIIDVSGVRFGHLVAIRHVGSVYGNSVWICRCDCGKDHTAQLPHLRHGAVKSCGCQHYKNLHAFRHGYTRVNQYHPLYGVWLAMRQRCNNPSHQAFENYGGRGIKVCERWDNSFPNFLADVGERPSPQHSIDRYPNNDGNYEPGNVRWATMKEQSNNRRNGWIVRKSRRV